MSVHSLTPRPVQVLPSNEHTSNGWTRPIITRTLDSQDKVVFKHNNEVPDWLRQLPGVRTYFERLADQRDVGEVVASHLMTDELGLDAVTYRPAFYIDNEGTRHKGIVSDFADNFKTMAEVGPEAICNPDQAVAQQVARAWMGDWDCIDNGNNTWIMAGGRAKAVDFGEAMKDGVRTMGLPDANRAILGAFGTPERIQPMLSTICQKSDDDIRGMVDRVGRRYIENWQPQQLEYYSGILIRNRERMKRQQPFVVQPWLLTPTAEKVTHFFTFGPGAPPRSVAGHVYHGLAKLLHVPPYYK